MKTPFGDSTRLAANFFEEIGGFVVLSGDMMQFDPSKFVLELAHLLAI